MKLRLTALLLCAPLAASGQMVDARTMATGGTELGRPVGDVVRVNPAYRAAPRFEPPGERPIPLPIGLLNADFPTFDTNDEDFDLIAAVDFLWNIPWALQIGRPDPLSGDVGIFVAQDRVVVDLKDARDIVPEDGLHAGDHHTIFELGATFDLGRRLGVVHVAPVQVFVIDEIEVDVDDALVDVLRRGEPIVGGRRYTMDARAVVQHGFSSSIAYAREIPLPGGSAVDGEDWLESYWASERDRPRLWAGLALRRYFGLTYAGVDGDLGMTGGEPLLGGDEDFVIDLDSRIHHSFPNGLTGWGTGWAVDLGMLLRWRSFELGAGVGDLFADLSWSKTRVQRYAYDPTPRHAPYDRRHGRTRRRRHDRARRRRILGATDARTARGTGTRRTRDAAVRRRRRRPHRSRRLRPRRTHARSEPAR